MSRHHVFALACAFLTLASTPTAAEPPPVEISSYWLFHREKSDNVRYHVCLSFINRSPQTVVAVRFHVYWLDAFNSTIANGRWDRVGSFAPDVTIDGPTDESQFYLRSYDSSFTEKLKNCAHQDISERPQTAHVYVDEVRFQDGTIWRRQPAAVQR